MPNFNYLTNNESDFPHLENVDVYKFDNDFDYGRFDAVQMELQICTVPWDVGEAHIGNRTISGIGNVVYFGSKDERDKWFNAIPDSECYRFTTKFKELHRSLEIDVPIPYDMCAKHNYLVVRYAKFANDDSPVVYEGDDGLREWFWFIREVEFLAPNTTRLHLLDDAFQTWIYDINISGMVLERGHAPMFDIKATEFLQNPVNRNDYLLTEDVNFGDASVVRHIDAVSLNAGTMYACFATTGYPLGSWGTKADDNWRVSTHAWYTQQGQPSVFVFCLPASNINSFLNDVSSTIPQFKQTVQGVWFASTDLITLGDSFSFAGHTCYRVQATRKTFDLMELDKSMFNYPSNYAEMAKLYTSPYAHIEVTDENGNVDIIKIEDSTGKLEINAAMNTAYPFITIDAHLSGVGGRVSKTVTFKNITNRSLDVSGQWYDTVRTWNVPIFAIVLDPTREYDYSTHYDRAQRVVEYTAGYNNAVDSANLISDNADIQAAANDAVTTASNTSVTSSNDLMNAYTRAMANAANYVIDGNATSTIAANEQQASVGAVCSVVNGAVGAVTSAASGNIAGAIGSAVGGIVGAYQTNANMTIGNALTAAQAGFAEFSNNSSSLAAQVKTGADGNIQITAATSITNANNAALTGSAANSTAVASGNALRDRNSARSGIENDISQGALRAPFVFGSFENGDTSTTRPMAVFAHVVTQSKSAIARAGDQFARYGYMLDGQWPFNGDWNIGKYFTYWKLKDFWVYNLNVPDMYMDKIRFFLFGGVTVWRSPEFIGKINIYDNF